MLPGLELPGWFALFGPPGIPRDSGPLNGAARRVIEDPEIAERIRQMGMDPMASRSEELLARVLRDREFYKPIVQAAGVQQD
jgi:tripartite-type tricarboxylate transporter receptor subunit TctC